MERTEDALKFRADMDWYDRSDEICTLLQNYAEELKVSYKWEDTGEYDERYFTNDHELFPENWVVLCDTNYDYDGEPKEPIVYEEFIELADALREIENFAGVKIPEGLEEAGEIREWLDEHVYAAKHLSCSIWRIN